MTKHGEFIRQARTTLTRAARPLACSVAIHLGLGAIVVAAGSAGLAAPHTARVVWLDLEPAEIPPPAAPAPPAVVSRPRPVPAPAVTPRKPAPTPAVEEPPVAPAPPAAPPREVAAPDPPPAQSAARTAEAPSVAASFKTPEPDPSAATSGTAAPSGATPGPQERGPEGPARSAVASRGPDAAPSGPIVGAARRRPGDDPAAHSHRDRRPRQRRHRRAIGRASIAGSSGRRRRAPLALRAGAELLRAGGDVGAGPRRVSNGRSRVSA